MIVTKLILIDYKRLALNNIKKFVYTPEKRLQLILGSNGSGKSSILKELSPLPADLKKDYRDGGMKEIHIEHNGSNYVLVSKYEKNKHSFIKDGEELNDGGTRKIQLKLVEDHFCITPAIHDVLTGRNSFTRMSVSERKKWLTNIADVDYEYPIGVYTRLKSRHRDIIGGLKLLHGKLANLENNIITEKERHELESNHNIAMDMIELLLHSKKDIRLEDNKDLKTKFENTLDEVERILNQIDPEFKEVKLGKIKTMISNEELKISYANSRINSILENMDKVIEKEALTDLDADKIIKDIDSKSKEIVNISNSIYLDLKPSDIDSAYSQLVYVNPDLTVVLGTLSELTDIDITPAVINEKQRYIKNLKEQNAYNKNILDSLLIEKSKMEENKNSNNISCSNCGHNWILGFDEEIYKRTLSKIDKVSITISKAEEEITVYDEYSKRLNEKLYCVDKFKGILNTNQFTAPILDYIVNVKKIDFTKYTQMTIDLLYSIMRDLEEWKEINIINLEVLELKQKLDYLEKSKKLLMDIQVDNKKQLEDTLNNQYKELDGFNNRLKVLNKEKDKIATLNDLYTTLYSQMLGIKENANKQVLSIKNDYINKAIVTLRVEISAIETKIKESEFTIKNIDAIKKDIENMENRKNVIEYMIKELSPSEGLIAKSIMNFLKGFTEAMNSVINKLWTYELKVLPCNVDKNDLNYRFPVSVDSKNTVEDISLTSSSMQEIIDLSFKIISMHQLGISDYPLILDEFGRTMDTEHRLRAYNITDILTNSFKQVYMVTHFSEAFGRFRNNDIIVISEDNLVLDDIAEYNKIVNIYHG